MFPTQDSTACADFRMRRWLPSVPVAEDCAQPTISSETSCTSVMRFLDTNVLIYAVSAASEDTAKRRRALQILTARDLALSVQVLQEFYVQSTRASRPGALTHDEAVDFAESLQRFRIQPITIALMRGAFTIRQRFGLSYWDSAILTAARMCDCNVIYSEDLSQEQDYDGLRVINPFAQITPPSAD